MGFQDESSPQTTSNTVRLWCTTKSCIVKNTDKLRANLFGFYPINGTPVIEAPENSKKEDMIDFLDSVRKANGDRQIVMILDNGPIHRAKLVTEHAESINIHLVFLPPYSPQLNPIELIWKSIKRIVSKTFFATCSNMVNALKESFTTEASKKSYVGSWRSIFYSELLK